MRYPHLRYYLRRAAFLGALLLYGGQCFASLPAAQLRPARPQGWSAAVLGPLLTLQQLDNATGRQILALKRVDGTTVGYIDIAGDGSFLGFIEPGAFATGSLPAVTASNAGAIAFDTTANQPKYVNNAGTWTPFAGTGTVSGTGTSGNLARWTGSTSLGNALTTDDGAGKVQINATPTAASTTALFDLGSEVASSSASGTFLGMNAGAPFLGNFIEAENFSVPEFSVDHNGRVNSSSLTATSFLMSDGSKNIVSGTSTDLTASGSTLNLVTQGGFTPGVYLNPALSVNSKGIVTGITNGTASGVTGSGTVNNIPKLTGASAIGNSALSDNGTTVASTENVSAPQVIDNGTISAGYLSTDGTGKLVGNVGSPLTSVPTWDATLGVSQIASHDLLVSGGHHIGSAGTPWLGSHFQSKAAGNAALNIYSDSGSAVGTIDGVSSSEMDFAGSGATKVSAAAGSVLTLAGGTNITFTITTGGAASMHFTAGTVDPAAACTDGDFYMRTTYTAGHSTLWVCQNAVWVGK